MPQTLLAWRRDLERCVALELTFDSPLSFTYGSLTSNQRVAQHVISHTVLDQPDLQQVDHLVDAKSAV
jgi:hypothetical protein